MVGKKKRCSHVTLMHACINLQIQESPQQGMGLMDTLSQRGVHGIINGLDTAAWDPQCDPYLSPRMRFTPATAARGKAAAKRWLQVHLGLPASSQIPMVAYVGRLTHQKGVDVLLKALYSCIGPDILAQETLSRTLGPQVRLLHLLCSLICGCASTALSVELEDIVCDESMCSLQASGGTEASQAATNRDSVAGGRWQVVVMGTGDEQLEQELKYLPLALPRRAATVVRFDERLAHRLMAAADILVVPSRFEPCGLVALSALRYGAVPVVASTGGLRDIVSGRFLLSDTGRGEVKRPIPPSRNLLPGFFFANCLPVQPLYLPKLGLCFFVFVGSQAPGSEAQVICSFGSVSCMFGRVC